jgi:hypothetical protein
MYRFIDRIDNEKTDYQSILMMDWADANGDGKDDFWLLWKYTNTFSADDLYVNVWLSDTPREAKTKLIFGGEADAIVDGFTEDVKIGSIDTEDFNNDGLADIVVYKPHWGDGIRIGYAQNTTTNNSFGFQPHKDWVGEEIEMGATSFEKRDSLDINNDGCADYVHLGKNKGSPSMSYLITLKCPKQN